MRIKTWITTSVMIFNFPYHLVHEVTSRFSFALFYQALPCLNNDSVLPKYTMVVVAEIWGPSQ